MFFKTKEKKIQVLTRLLEENNISPSNTIYIGDDINDIECLNFVGHPYTVANAHTSVKNLERINITTNNGGNGAFREIMDKLP